MGSARLLGCVAGVNVCTCVWTFTCADSPAHRSLPFKRHFTRSNRALSSLCGHCVIVVVVAVSAVAVTMESWCVSESLLLVPLKSCALMLLFIFMSLSMVAHTVCVSIFLKLHIQIFQCCRYRSTLWAPYGHLMGTLWAINGLYVTTKGTYPLDAFACDDYSIVTLFVLLYCLTCNAPPISTYVSSGTRDSLL